MIAAAASMITAGCASAETPVSHDARPAISAPDLQRHAGRAAAGNLVHTQRNELLQAALSTARDIAADAADSGSLVTPISELALSNESSLVAGQKIGTMFPNMSMSFDPGTRSIALSSIQRLNPDAPLIDTQLSSLSLSFSLLGGPTVLDIKYRENRQLDAADFVSLVQANDGLVLTKIDLIQPQNDTETVLDMSATGDYITNGQLGAGIPPTRTIMSPNDSSYGSLSRELDAFDKLLASGAAQFSN